MMKHVATILLAFLIIDVNWVSSTKDPTVSILEVETASGHFYVFKFKTKEITGNEKEIVKAVKNYIKNKEQ
jgi:hypothetical protein